MDIGGHRANPHYFSPSRPNQSVIAGFNTDIEFDGTVYHVQTEDKGAPAHMIMSLVYDKGTILASKRSTYDDLAATNFDEAELSERLTKQHKLICAAVKAGRINELVDMTRKASASARAKAETAAVVERVGIVESASTVSVPMSPPPEAPRTPIDISILETPTFETISFDDLPVIDAQIIDDIEILPAEAVAVVSELSGQDRPTNQKLSLDLLGDPKFRGGERKTVNLMLCRGTDRKVVANAQIMVKLLGSAFRPVIFHAKTDQNGLARVHLQVPQFQAGRAALLVRAIAGGEEIELRRIVTPG